MANRRDLRHPDRWIDTPTHDRYRTWTDALLDLCERVATTWQWLYATGAFVLLSLFVYWAILGLPSLLIALVWLTSYLVRTFWPTSLVFWVTFPFALALTYFGLWLSTSLETRRKEGVQRGRRIVTADSARREARRQLDDDDHATTIRFPRRY